MAIAFLAGIAVGFGGRSVRVLAVPQSDTRAANLAAIEKLHQEDIQVTLSQDEKGLTDIWTDDAVRFNPPSPPAVGKQAIRAENEKFHAEYPGFKVLSYTPKSATFKSRTAWHVRGSKVKPISKCPQTLLQQFGMSKDFEC